MTETAEQFVRFVSGSVFPGVGLVLWCSIKNAVEIEMFISVNILKHLLLVIKIDLYTPVHVSRRLCTQSKCKYHVIYLCMKETR